MPLRKTNSHPLLSNGVRKVPYFAAALFFIVFAALPASAQYPSYTPMPSGTNYSDTWLVGHNQPTTDEEGNEVMSPNGEPWVEVRGYGAYEEPYNSYGHILTVNVGMGSPDGRAATNSASRSGYARAEVGMPLGAEGEYYTSHDSRVYCPTYGGSYLTGGGRTGRRIGISYSAFYKAAQVDSRRAVYQLVQPCDVTCVFYPSGSFQRLSNGSPMPNYVRIGEPFVVLFGYRVCESIIRSYEESADPLTCYERGV